MAKKKSGRKSKALDEIMVLKGKRRASIIKCALAITIIAVVIMGKPMLEMAGVIEEGNMVAAAAMYLTAIVLAVFSGKAGTDYAKSGNRIKELCQSYSLTDSDIKAYERL